MRTQPTLEAPLPPLLASFVGYLVHERNYSPHSVQAYQSDLIDLGRFAVVSAGIDPLATHEEAAALTARHIRRWLGQLSDPKRPEGALSKRSLARKLSAVRHYYRYARRQGWVTKNPVQAIELPKAEKRLPAFAREADMQRVLDPTRFTADVAGQRARLVLELLYGCGLRRAELIGLTWEAIDVPARQLRVLGKGRKERLVPFGPTLADTIDAYRAVCLQAELPVTGWFIRTDKGEPAYPQFIYQLVHRALGGIPGLSKASPHVLRHTFATHLVDRGADLNAVKELLGHASLASTQVYVHTSAQRLKDAHRKAHPRADAPSTT